MIDDHVPHYFEIYFNNKIPKHLFQVSHEEITIKHKEPCLNWFEVLLSVCQNKTLTAHFEAFLEHCSINFQLLNLFMAKHEGPPDKWTKCAFHYHNFKRDIVGDVGHTCNLYVLLRWGTGWDPAGRWPWTVSWCPFPSSSSRPGPWPLWWCSARAHHPPQRTTAGWVEVETKTDRNAYPGADDSGLPFLFL